MGTSPSLIKKIYVDPDTGQKPPDGRLKPPPLVQPGDVQPPLPKGRLKSELYTTNMEQNLVRAKIAKNSKRAQAMLESLGFDPITRLVEQYNRIEADIRDYDRLRINGPDYDAEGKMIRKFSSMGYSALLAIQQKVITELLPYGYSKQIGNEDDSDRPLPRLSIVLTPKGGNAAAMELQTYSENDQGQTYEQ